MNYTQNARNYIVGWVGSQNSFVRTFLGIEELEKITQWTVKACHHSIPDILSGLIATGFLFILGLECDYIS